MSRNQQERLGGRAARILKDKVRMLVLLTLVASVAGYGGGAHRFLELTSHFRVQYLLAAGAFTLILLLLRDWRWSLAGLLGLGINGAEVLPWYMVRPDEPQPGAPLRLLLSNVYTGNLQTERVLELVREESPDVVVLQEVDFRWLGKLKALDSVMSHSKAVPRVDNFGIGIWSRLPLHDVREISSGAFAIPSLLAEVEVSGRRISILATHPMPPVSAEGFAERNAQLSQLAALGRQSSTPLILLGDLNLTMWSPFHAQLLQDSGLVNARRGFGVIPTWPTHLPVMKIPLDHCLVSPTLGVREIRAGKPVGSDHLPVIVDLIIPASE